MIYEEKLRGGLYTAGSKVCYIISEVLQVQLLHTARSHLNLPCIHAPAPPSQARGGTRHCPTPEAVRQDSQRAVR